MGCFKGKQKNVLFGVRKSVAKLCENSGHQRFVDITKGFKKI
jgi:hypothetical protein